MSETMQFSIVITTYNYAHHVERAIRSAVSQEGDDFEVLLVDDGSTDDTPLIVEQLLARHEGAFRYVRKENGGPASARNLGTREATGRYILFLDADDELCDGLLPRLRTFFDEHPDVRFLVGDHISVNASGREKVVPVPPMPNSARARFEAYVVRRYPISHGSIVYHREVFSRLSYPEQFRAMEDVPMFAQTLALFESASLNIPFVKVHKHGDSLRHNIANVKAAGLNIVDALFDPQILPREFMHYRDNFLVRRSLSLFRALYVAREDTEAFQIYLRAIRTKPSALLDASSFRKFVRLCFRRLFRRNGPASADSS